MHSVMLQSGDGQFLGAMLLSSSLAEGAGDCVFMAVPAAPELFGTAPAQELMRRKAVGESAWEVTSREPVTLRVKTPGAPGLLYVELGEDAPGRWGIETGNGRAELGIASVPSGS